MNNYKTEYAKGGIKSIFYETLPVKYCNSVNCISYNGKYFDFIEKNFNDNLRNGIYTIRSIEKQYSKDYCFSNDFYSENKKCFIAEKNEENKIKSKYKFKFENDMTERRTLIEFKNIETNETLYKISYQLYSTGAIGGPGFSYCKGQKNNPLYKFNALSFPYNNGEE